MTQACDRLDQLASSYDAIIFDQWGVLHNGSKAYPGAVACLRGLAQAGHRLGVLSNSGKRSAANATRIAEFGYADSWFEMVMTSGEALWRDIADGRVREARFWPLERSAGDAAAWADGFGITLTEDLMDAEAVLLMGLPDGTELEDLAPSLEAIMARNLPTYCSNPDKASPRHGGPVTSPGAVAQVLQDRGAKVTYYGKPHRPVFDAVELSLGTDRLLIVGDSLDHDIVGGQGAGWDTLLIQGGLYAERFANGDADENRDVLVAQAGCAPPTYRMETLR